ncbi:MAG: helix-turn-helix transcriptional regulator [Clostridia bacterium]|nr:helix-turn-helix transcriptional regulator [Clostridia bacterium]
MSISEKITLLRKEKNLSQEAFAEALGVSRQSVSKWESGSALPDTDKIIAMSELFGVSTDYLLKDDAVSTEPVTYNPPENPSDETEETERNDDMFSKKKKKKGKGLKIIALVLALIILAAAIGIPSYFGGFREAWWELNGGKVQYPYILVHGLGG